jgi:DNA-binding CsgD family transcriptional regulator
MTDPPPFAAESDVPGARLWFVAACRLRWGLSPCQAGVLYELARGLTLSKEIGRGLGKSANLVDTHLGAAYRRLGLTGAGRGADHKTAAVVKVWDTYSRAREIARKEHACNSARNDP